MLPMKRTFLKKNKKKNTVTKGLNSLLHCSFNILNIIQRLCFDWVSRVRQPDLIMARFIFFIKQQFLPVSIQIHHCDRWAFKVSTKSLVLHDIKCIPMLPAFGDVVKRFCWLVW